MSEVKSLYKAQAEAHMEAGDDLMNALARIADAGCPPDVYAEIEKELEAEEDEEDDE